MPRHCTIPAPEAGYSPSPVVEPVTVGQEINYTCAGAFATVEGTGSSTHTIQCGNDTNFPSGWPKCKVCMHAGKTICMGWSISWLTLICGVHPSY